MPDTQPDPHHHFHINTHLGSLHLHADIHLTDPWTILFGPSGSGKSSILRSICGILPNTAESSFPSPSLKSQSSRPTNGSGETPVFWCISKKTPPHRRNLAYAPQGSHLFPHLTVRQNIAFPLTTRNLPPEINDLLTLFDLSSLADRHPHDLSGGERQRVNLARAFAVPTPSLVLLDEPFTGLDRTLRSTLIPRMAAHLAARNLPVLSVTHDVEEAVLLNAYILRIEAGHITTHGPAPEVLSPERHQILKTLT